ncbi:hypothetical protein [Flavobacterium sp. JP2137]|uniref:hypothetical protein n=1 Tax=Flavobacterium sp. JP2137 TaxID=3414510 RepID=UPI003D2FD678
MISKNHRKDGDRSSFNSKNYPLRKELKNYSTKKLDRAFFSDENVKDLRRPLLYNRIPLFDNSDLDISVVLINSVIQALEVSGL